jgi:hemerythrin
MRNTPSTNPDDPPFHWSDALLLGHGAMDATHREFVDLVAALSRAEDGRLAGLLDTFIAHTEEHFSAEDRWMVQSAFPAADCHRDEHAAVLATVHTARRKLAQGDATLCRRVVSELIRWFPAHVEQLDSALAQWLCKRQHAAVPLVLRRGVTRNAFVAPRSHAPYRPGSAEAASPGPEITLPNPGDWHGAGEPE